MHARIEQGMRVSRPQYMREHQGPKREGCATQSRGLSAKTRPLRGLDKQENPETSVLSHIPVVIVNNARNKANAFF